MNIDELKKGILPILKHYDVQKAGVFGSFARKEDQANSDIDILVDIKSKISLLGFVKFKHQLEDALGRKVDLVEYNTIKPIIKQRILSEEIRIL